MFYQRSGRSLELTFVGVHVGGAFVVTFHTWECVRPYDDTVPEVLERRDQTGHGGVDYESPLHIAVGCGRVSRFATSGRFVRLFCISLLMGPLRWCLR